ncbi:hypothetical protein H4R34_002885 [Dimargaris verticillata]|uniref:Uncharacterized protein n=1 Tax=Dimargaris verticillata TaxID=2761393 RepID=A0A9W8E9K5_9FUNG|nr:hypothetical protein H4R34_002885 [Dimargaris verticillata]
MHRFTLLAVLGYTLLASPANARPTTNEPISNNLGLLTPPLTPGKDVQYEESPLGASPPSTSSCIAIQQDQALSSNSADSSSAALIDHQWSDAALIRLGTWSRLIPNAVSDKPARKNQLIPELYRFFRGGALLTLVSGLQDERAQAAILNEAGLRLSKLTLGAISCGDMAHWHPLLLFSREGHSDQVKQGITVMHSLVNELPVDFFTVPDPVTENKLVTGQTQDQPDFRLEQAVIHKLKLQAPAAILAGLQQYIQTLSRNLETMKDAQLLHVGSTSPYWQVAQSI